MMKHIFVFIFILIIAGKLSAQDLHFSQFYNIPLILNPSTTGAFKEDYRLVVAYRNQWRQANSAFASGAFNGEINFGLGDDKIGVGLLLFNDQMGSQILKNNTALGSLAYHKFVDHAKRHKVSVGFQGGYVQKGIDYSTLFFGNQISNYQYDPSLSSNESPNTKFSYFSLNSGLSWVFKVDQQTSIHTGATWFNMTNPKETFVADVLNININKLRNRAIFSGGMEREINDKLSIHPEFMVMTQSKAMDINIGSALGYKFINASGGDPIMLQAGLWYRLSDALIFMTGARYKSWKVGLTYDATVSGFIDIKQDPKVGNKARIGAYEITITYLGVINRARAGKHTIPCGFF